MTPRIAGMAWVTPLGSALEEVCERVIGGEQAVAKPFDSEKPDEGFAYRVPAEAITNLPAHPRLRRSSAISRFAASAGLSALKNAGVEMNSETAGRTALIFAIANGGVVYTRRFFQDVVSSGARSASPLLFPETVFNAPASHLAAVLGISGITYTLVGDGAVGILAIKMAADLLANGAVDRCLVVGAEEADPLVYRAYRRWRLCRTAPPMAVYEQAARGMILSEGAGAILLHAGSGIALDRVDSGENYYRRRDLPEVLAGILSRLADQRTGAIVTSANGTFIDHAEQHAIARYARAASVFTPKLSLGESVAASTLWQTILAALVLQSEQGDRDRNVVVLGCGVNQQAAGLRLTYSD